MIQIHVSSKKKKKKKKKYFVLLSVIGALGVNYFFNSSYLCRLLITFANRLDPDQAQHFVVGKELIEGKE